MKRMILLIVLLIIMVPVSIYIAGNIYFSEARLIKMNWGIEIPSEFNVLYSKKETGFQGDGERFTVFNAGETKLAFIDRFSSKRDSDTEEFVQTVETSLDVPKEYRVSFNKPYSWWETSKSKDGSELVIVYIPLPDGGKFYCIERLL